MPLLRNAEFLPNPLPTKLSPNERVFFCRLTREVFTDYDDFFERSILCNSMVWACSLSRRGGLTYYEALKCERNCQREIDKLDRRLQAPILILAGLSSHSRLTDLLSDVFSYTRVRYAIGEEVLVLTGGEWRSGIVTNVICPALLRYKKLDPKSPLPVPPPRDLQYTVSLRAASGSPARKMACDADVLTRKRNTFSKPRCHGFLKLCCQQSGKVWEVKEDFIVHFELDKYSFEDFWGACPLPDFAVPSHVVAARRSRVDTNNFFKTDSPTNKRDIQKAQRAELHQKRTSDADLKTSNRGKSKKSVEPEKPLSKAELAKLKKEEKDAEKKERERLLEEARNKEREEKKLRAEWLKSWGRTRDDLELEDHKPLPVPQPIECSSIFGPMLQVLEFTDAFGSLFHLKDFLPGGLTLDLLYEAVTSHDFDSPLFRILNCLLSAILDGLEDGNTYDIGFDDQLKILTEISENDWLTGEVQSTLLSSCECVFWCKNILGMPLSRIPLNQYTISECLRIHFMSSGFKTLPEVLRWKIQKMMVFSPHDDPGVEFRNQNPKILQDLSSKSVYMLLPEEKLKIMTCLCDQLLTRPECRDLIEKSQEQFLKTRVELRALERTENKREKELSSAKSTRRQRSALVKLQSEESSSGVSSVADITGEDEESIARRKRSYVDMLLRHDKPHLTDQQLFELESLFDSEDEFLSPLEQTAFQSKRARIHAAHDKDFSSKHNKLAQSVFDSQTTCAAFALGRDRAHRRYWRFRSLPGLFVEEDNQFRNWAKTNITSGDFIPPCLTPEPNWEVEEAYYAGTETTFPKWPLLELVESGKPHKKKWSVYSTEEELNQLLDSLNQRGLRESSLFETLNREKDSIVSINNNGVISALTSPYEFECHSVDQLARFRDSCKVLFQRLFACQAITPNYTITRKRQLFELLSLDVQCNGIIPENVIKSCGQFFFECFEYIKSSMISEPLSGKHDKRYLRSDTSSVTTDNEELISYEVAESDYITRWLDAARNASGLPQLYVFLYILSFSISWSKSVLKNYCQTCLRMNEDDEGLVVCKFCTMAYHKPCFGPFPASQKCSECRVYERRTKSKVGARKPPTRKDSDVSSNTQSKPARSQPSSRPSSPANAKPVQDKFAVLPLRDDGVICEACDLGGFVVCCDGCPKMFHLKCADPPLSDVPTDDWFCQLCTGKATADDFTARKKIKRKSSRLAFLTS